VIKSGRHRGLGLRS